MDIICFFPLTLYRSLRGAERLRLYPLYRIRVMPATGGGFLITYKFYPLACHNVIYYES